MALRMGEVFAGYTVVGQLGGGGMGEVYLAQHPRLPRQDALKILRADISVDEGFRQRFIREADSVAVLSHPNIVMVFDRGEFNGKLWIATEYVNGTDAAQLMRDRYPAGMPAVEAAAIAAAIGDALDYAHERGLLHRDVKPANILLSDPDRTGRRRVFLADFGIARPLGDPSGLTATNFTVGTVSYAAPEQLMGADIDGRADQYALAATAFHLLAGKPPFEDSNPIAVISKHLTLPPPQLGAIRPDLSGLDHILATAMAKEPNQRYPHCAEFTTDLTRGATLNPVLPHAPTLAAVPAPVPSTPVPGPPAAATHSAVPYAADRADRDAGPPASPADTRRLAAPLSDRPAPLGGGAPSGTEAEAARKVAAKQHRRRRWQAFQMQRKEDKRLLPYMIAAFLAIVAIAVLAALLTGGYIMYPMIAMGIVLGVRVALIIFARRAHRAVYRNAKGQSGPAAVGRTRRQGVGVLGILVALFGVLFTLQGFGAVQGSPMSNTMTWSVLGPIIALIGVGLAIGGWRGR